MRPLTDKVVIVTGASSGIGESVARRLARAGAWLVINARRKEPLAALASELDPAGTHVLAIAGDITDAAVRQRLVDESVAKFGGIDALVNNAGYGTRGPVELVPVDLIRRNFETNLFSLIALTQLVVPLLRKRGGGRIVNIGSVAGRIARPLSSVYDSTKHALEAITDGLRGELAPSGIQVTLIRPGFIVSGFLDASNKASESILANGGFYAPYFKSFPQNHQRLRRIAGRPDDIAKLVEKALTLRRPAPRYSGPLHAKLFLFLRWLLPARAIDWSVRLKKR